MQMFKTLFAASEWDSILDKSVQLYRNKVGEKTIAKLVDAILLISALLWTFTKSSTSLSNINLFAGGSNWMTVTNLVRASDLEIAAV